MYMNATINNMTKCVIQRQTEDNLYCIARTKIYIDTSIESESLINNLFGLFFLVGAPLLHCFDIVFNKHKMLSTEEK